MKKNNKIMKTSAVLVVIALLTAWGANGIYAKYVTDGEQEDAARVASWGVVMEPNSEGTFSATYAKDDTNYTLGDNSVIATSENKVVAPGTNGTFKGLKVSGTPEVAVKITNEGTVTLTGWTVSKAYYCPLKVTVGTTELYGLDYTTADAFANAIAAEIAKVTSYQTPGTDLEKATGVVPEVTWEWPFEGDNGSKVTRTDEKDTALANLETAPTVNIKIKTTVTQVN